MEHRSDPIAAAMAITAERFSATRVALLGGSVARGQGRPRSDLDIVVVGNDPEAPYRWSFHHSGWPVECFVNTDRSLQWFWNRDRERGVATLAAICAEGVVVGGDAQSAAALQEAARAFVEAGPPELTAHECDAQRYRLTGLVEDLRDALSAAEQTLLAVDVARVAAELKLRSERQWVGDGKQLLALFARVDAGGSERFVRALETPFSPDGRDAAISFALNVLGDVGGELFEYRQPGPSIARS